jgi:hypothetical protein
LLRDRARETKPARRRQCAASIVIAMTLMPPDEANAPAAANTSLTALAVTSVGALGVVFRRYRHEPARFAADCGPKSRIAPSPKRASFCREHLQQNA